ncbi:hypothetical protein EVAR_30037_1 [Eumeta japonica]|uniref:Endonuclease/exonuclease/phosphatase domain-containing protein n=1 Tax=Eumeta variegata TaxID=151549 RepID=A0A4C1VWU2_EUMVA|nr:hypothetical protein EVAR_30037_1 [Eumeta japonica]
MAAWRTLRKRVNKVNGFLEYDFRFASHADPSPANSPSRLLGVCIKALEEREEFWADIRDILEKYYRNERIVMSGDFNDWVALATPCDGDSYGTRTNKSCSHVKERYKKYFEIDFACENTAAGDNVTVIEYENDKENEFTMDAIMKQLKRTKAVGYDMVSSVILRGDGVCWQAPLYQLFNKCWNKRRVPNAWCQDTIIPLYNGLTERLHKLSPYKSLQILEHASNAVNNAHATLHFLYGILDTKEQKATFHRLTALARGVTPAGG